MKISLNWLKEYIDTDLSVEKISETLTNTGLEIEGVETFESIPGGLKGVVIGEVLTCEKHPNADKLKVTTVDIGTGDPAPIVCGAPNVAIGQKVVIATVNTTLYPTGGESFKIKKAKIRGEVSEGMICAEDEIGLGTSHDGIMVLDTDLSNGTPASDYFKPETDTVYEIGITPNRADGLSHIGAARDLRAVYGQEVRLPEVAGFTTDNKDLVIPVEVENTDACPRYTALTMKDITVKDSPEWLKNRLRAIGQTPINNIVDITNFVLHELGQPMHAFDADAITGNKVIVKTMPAGSRFITLDEKERKLAENDLMICNSEGGMCIAGVFGGIQSGVTEKTTNLFLESAYFSPDYVRKTAQHHGLKTDASFRFERGTDPNITEFALKRAALLIKELAGGSISSDIVDIYPEPIKDFIVPVKYRNINRLIGIEIERGRIKEILARLDIRITDEKEEGFTAIVPPYRVDVQREADIIEEILRIFGYNNIPLVETAGSDYLSDFPQIDKDKVQLRIAELLADNGYYEIVTNSLTKPAYSEQMASIDPANNVEVLNKLSEDLGVLRQSLLPSGLEVIAHNVNRRQSNLKLFEFGRIYRKDTGYNEQNRLDLFVSGDRQEESWQQPTKQAGFHDIYGSVVKIMDRFGLEIKVSQDTHPDYVYSAVVIHHKTEVARLGKVAPGLTRLVEVSQDVFHASINWDYLVSMKQTAHTVDEVSKFPEVRRDLSLVIDQQISFAQVEEVALKSNNHLLKSINVFDVYQGDKIDAGKKAYALSFILQDSRKTLTDKVIDKTMSKLMQAFESELGAVIRK